MSASLVKNPERLTFVRRELVRAGGYTPDCRDYLKHNNLSLGTIIAHAGFLEVVLATFYQAQTGERTFAIDQDGVSAAVVEALLFDYSREQVTADYVAWPLCDPTSFATALGLNDGADVLGPQNMVKRNGAPLAIHRTPLEWLQAGCDGCVLLKPESKHACAWLVQAGGPFIARDLDHGRQIRDLLGPFAKHHRILVPDPRQARAA